MPDPSDLAERIEVLRHLLSDSSSAEPLYREPSALKDVPSITTSGTSALRVQSVNAELQGGSGGDIPRTEPG